MAQTQQECDRLKTRLRSIVTTETITRHAHRWIYTLQISFVLHHSSLHFQRVWLLGLRQG